MAPKKYLYYGFIFSYFLIGIGCQNSNTGTVKDIDGNIYKTVKIGNHWWMAENLKVTKTSEGTPIQSYFYMDDSVKYSKYGRLYTWPVTMNSSTKDYAQGIAPDGWHIPSKAEWDELVTTLGGVEQIGEKIRVGGSAGFDAYLSGGADFNGNYLYFEKYAMFWSSTETGEDRAYHMGIDANNKYEEFAAKKGARIHVRCVKN